MTSGVPSASTSWHTAGLAVFPVAFANVGSSGRTALPAPPGPQPMAPATSPERVGQRALGRELVDAVRAFMRNAPLRAVREDTGKVAQESRRSWPVPQRIARGRWSDSATLAQRSGPPFVRTNDC